MAGRLGPCDIAPRLHLVLTQVLQQIATTLESFNAVLGLEALNEPWQYTPLDVLKAFYWDAYWAVRAAAPHWLFVIQVFPFDCPECSPENVFLCPLDRIRFGWRRGRGS